MPLIIGIISYPEQFYNTTLLRVTLIAVLGFLSVLIVSLINSLKTNSAISFLSINGFFFFAAWLLCFFAEVRNDKHWFGHRIEQADSFNVVIKQPPKEKDKTWKLEVSVTHSINNHQTNPATGNAFIYVYKYPAVFAFREGDTITVPNNWQLIENSGNPFEFDYKAYAARSNIHFQQFISAKDINIIHYAEAKNLNWIRRIHHWSKRQLEWYIKDAATLGLLDAILLGDKTDLKPELKQAYADTGIVHTIAISGAHIGIFFLLVLLLLFWIKHKKYTWIKYLIALPLIWGYVLIAGAPASAVRSATMFSIIAIGFAIQKQPNGINQLLAAAFIILCADPILIYNIGFQLSFIAVLSIFIFYRPINRSIFFKHKILKLLWGAMSVSLAAEILVAPIVVYYFHLFPIQFLIANLVAYLFMGVILIGGMLLIGLSFVPVIAEPIASILTFITTGFNRIIYLLKSLNLDVLRTLTLNLAELCLTYIIITAGAVFIFRKKKSALHIATSVFVVFIAWNIYEWRQTQSQQILVMYNIRNDSYTELINGNNALIAYSKRSPSASTQQYVLQPAHINWHIQSVDTTLPQESKLITVGNKNVYLHVQKYLPPTDVDYLLLTEHNSNTSLTELMHLYTPDTVVIGNSFSKSAKALLYEQCAAFNLPVHDVSQNGAFILQSN